MIALSKFLDARNILNTVRNYAVKSSIVKNIKPLPRMPTGLASFSEDNVDEFMHYFPEMVNDVVENKETSNIREVMERFREVVYYTVPNGKRVRGLTTVISYKYLEKPENLTPENIRLANMLGWCTELFGAAILVYDDIVDNSDTRRKAPCWFRKEGVGLTAVFDAILLESYAFVLLKKCFSNHPFYVPMIDLFHEVYRKTALGQCMDTVRHTAGGISMDRFKAIAEFKTGYYTFYFPTVLGMYLSKTYNTDLLRQSKPLLLDMGEFFQIQNDINDCYGNLDVTGKFGTDIQEGKCTWLSVMALQKANPDQRKILEWHYGRPDEESVQAIRDVYDQLDLRSLYASFEKDSFDKKCALIRKFKSPQKEMFLYLVEKVYKRKYEGQI